MAYESSLSISAKRLKVNQSGQDDAVSVKAEQQNGTKRFVSLLFETRKKEKDINNNEEFDPGSG